MYIVWDNSNIHYAGLDHVRPLIEPTVPKELYRTYFEGVLDLVKGERKVDDVYFCGSNPPQKGDNLWNAVSALGIEPKIIPRSLSEGEADTTDRELQVAILHLFFDHPVPDTIALLTGDGAGIHEGMGFLADSKRLFERGWRFEVFSWGIACHSELRDFGLANGKYVKLEDYYYNITFIKGGRRPVPISQ